MNIDFKNAIESLAIARQQVDEMHEDYKKLIVLAKMLWEHIDEEKDEMQISTGEEILEMVEEKLSSNYDKAAEAYITLDHKIKEFYGILYSEKNESAI